MDTSNECSNAETQWIGKAKAEEDQAPQRRVEGRDVKESDTDDILWQAIKIRIETEKHGLCQKPIKTGFCSALVAHRAPLLVNVLVLFFVGFQCKL